MFDIGFLELLVIAVVALLVVGPDEFPALVKRAAGWMSKGRHFVSAVKAEFEREIEKAEELKRLVAEQSRIAEVHKILDETRQVIPVDYEARRPATPPPSPDVPPAPPAQPVIQSSAPSSSERKHEAAP